MLLLPLPLHPITNHVVQRDPEIVDRGVGFLDLPAEGIRCREVELLDPVQHLAEEQQHGADVFD